MKVFTVFVSVLQSNTFLSSVPFIVCYVGYGTEKVSLLPTFVTYYTKSLNLWLRHWITVLYSYSLIDCLNNQWPLVYSNSLLILFSDEVVSSEFWQLDNSNSGERSQIVCGIFAEESLYGSGIAYTITSATSIRYGTSTLLCFLPNFLFDGLVWETW